MKDTEFIERIAIVKSLRYDSSLALVTFQENRETFMLVGDRRMTEPIREYIGKKVVLYITSQSIWSWQPLEDFNSENES